MKSVKDYYDMLLKKRKKKQKATPTEKQRAKSYIDDAHSVDSRINQVKNRKKKMKGAMKDLFPNG